MSDEKIVLVRRFFSGTGATYDRIANLCTIGFDRLWKQKMVQKIPEGSAFILDQACGTGILTLEIARRFPRSQIVGVDVMEEYLAIAKQKAADRKVGNVHFVVGKAEDVLIDRNFDCVTSSYLAKYADLRTLILNVKHMLKPGAVLIMHDFTYPRNNVFSRVWELYFKLLQTIGTWANPQWKTVFDDLPALLRVTNWLSELSGLLKENGFSDIGIESLTLGTSAIVTATKT